MTASPGPTGNSSGACRTSGSSRSTRRELFMGPNNIPEFVDHHGSEFELYKRAADMGYTPIV